jgi:glycosyltransferase involved in cell wall biosynthesis
MRVLWYNWRDIKNPEAGGAEVFTHEVCKRLVKKQHVKSVTVFAASFEGGLPEETVDGVRIVRRGDKYSVYSEAKKFYKQNKNDFDILVDEINTKPFNTPNYVHEKPIVALIHQLAREFWFYETRFPVNLIGYFFLENHWLKKYRNIPTMAVSKSTAEDLQKLGFGCVTIVPEGIGFPTLQHLPEKEPLPTVLFVGRLKKAKRPDDALRAFRNIKAEVPDAQLWIIGDGYMMQELRTMANEMFPGSPNVGDNNNSNNTNSNSCVIFFGKQSNAKKLELMSKAHVLLVPGIREGWGLVVTEANAMGTPAIAYDVHGLRDSVIDGSTGLLVHSGDHVAMAIEAVELLKNDVKRITYSRNALQHANSFDWDKTADSIFRELATTYHHLPEETLKQITGGGPRIAP